MRREYAKLETSAVFAMLLVTCAVGLFTAFLPCMVHTGMFTEMAENGPCFFIKNGDRYEFSGYSVIIDTLWTSHQSESDEEPPEVKDTRQKMMVNGKEYILE